MIAPTGTIAFMMDCDTTGIEPDIALVKYKKLVGGGMLKIVNDTVPRALKRLGYDSKEIQEIVEYLDEHETIEGAPHLADAHLRGLRLRLQAARRRAHDSLPGPSQDDGRGAAVHLGRDFQDHQHARRSDRRRSRRGLRDGVEARAQGGRDLSRRLQAHAAAQHRQEPKSAARGSRSGGDGGGRRSDRSRRKLPDERKSITHKFDIAGHEGYITVGMYEDGTPGEIFVTMSKQGSTISGLMDSFATAISLRAAIRRAAAVPGRQIRAHALRAVGLHQESADSVRQVDRRLPVPLDGVEIPRRGGEARSRNHRVREEPDDRQTSDTARGARCAPIASLRDGKDGGIRQAFINQADAPPCPDCGCIMVRNGACYKCMNCGTTSGCS